MASVAILAAVQPAPINDNSGSSLYKLLVKPNRQALGLSNFKTGAVVAKYGNRSLYFDLENFGNTTGQWDLYESDAPSPYKSLQSYLLETFAAPFTKR